VRLVPTAASSRTVLPWTTHARKRATAVIIPRALCASSNHYYSPSIAAIFRQLLVLVPDRARQVPSPGCHSSSPSREQYSWTLVLARNSQDLHIVLNSTSTPALGGARKPPAVYPPGNLARAREQHPVRNPGSLLLPMTSSLPSPWVDRTSLSRQHSCGDEVTEILQLQRGVSCLITPSGQTVGASYGQLPYGAPFTPPGGQRPGPSSTEVATTGPAGVKRLRSQISELDLFYSPPLCLSQHGSLSCPLPLFAQQPVAPVDAAQHGNTARSTSRTPAVTTGQPRGAHAARSGTIPALPQRKSTKLSAAVAEPAFRQEAPPPGASARPYAPAGAPGGRTPQSPDVALTAAASGTKSAPSTNRMPSGRDGLSPACSCSTTTSNSSDFAPAEAATATGRSLTPPVGSPTGPDSCPPHGCKGSCGQRSQMQDAHTVVQNFVHLDLGLPPPGCARWPETLSARPSSPTPAAEGSGAETQARGVGPETFHFFGVFDGHGGQVASQYCARTLHANVLEALGGQPGYRFSPRPLPPNAAPPDTEEEGESVQVLGQKAEVRAGNWLGDSTTEPETLEAAMMEAFVRTDEEVAAEQAASGAKDYAGSTAVVSLVSKSLLWVANCGDSRAVLLRDGAPLQLSSDQTAARPDEVARIEDAGGEIYYLQDCPRVGGVLAMSRSIGDHYLAPFVIPHPEYTAIPRKPGSDELLILGTDGLWDKLSNEYACEVAKRCLARAKAKGASRKAAAKCAATVLIRTAIQKGSRDNVTAIVVDLAGPDAPAAPAPAQQ